MADLNGFNANEVEPSGSYEPIPAGKYPAMIVASSMEPTKNRNGSYLKLEFEVSEGQYKGRLLWARLNLENPNPTAVDIARKELSAICHAVELMTPRDSEELHNLPLVIAVKCKKREDTGDITNEIAGYFKPGDGGAGAAAKTSPRPSAPSAPAAPAKPATAPWNRPAPAANTSPQVDDGIPF